MAEHTLSGRHRSASRYNPVAEISSIVKSAGETGVKASAVLAASGGLVATFALPAQAATHGAQASSTKAAPAAAPQAFLATPAVVAPRAAAPVATDVVGVSGLKAVAKPKPKPKPAPAAPQQASRSAQRTSFNDSLPQSSSAIVNIARTLLGIPYVYGGSTPSGFDCSGFTMYVFGQAGISIPRTASAQQAAATPVSNPQPGDLVFFGSPAWHVGIYVGNGMMIDSPKPGKSTSVRPVFSGVSGYGRF